MNTRARKPIISIVMSVYNGATYLRHAIDSILHQSFSDFEFIIINDASTDETESIIGCYYDPRIVYIKNEDNLQLPKSLNKGLAAAQGKYIARIDADDISLPHRLQTQFEFMEANPDIGVCGSWVEIMGLDEGEIWKTPTTANAIQTQLFFHNCLSHPSIMMRHSVLEEHQLQYDEKRLRAQDWQLWIDMTKHTKVANIPEILLLYRRHRENLTYKDRSVSAYHYQQVRAQNLARLNIELSTHELTLYSQAMHQWLDIDEDSFIELDHILTLICQRNRKVQLFPEDVFEQYLIKNWLSHFRQLQYAPVEKLIAQDWYNSLPNWTQMTLRKPLTTFLQIKTTVTQMVILEKKQMREKLQLPQHSMQLQKVLTRNFPTLRIKN